MLAILLFVMVILVLMLGYPVAFTLSGVSILFALICSLTNNFDLSILYALPSRIFGIITNETLVAIPMFIFMGIMLEKSKIAEKLLDSMAALFKNIKGGLGISVIIVGAIIAGLAGNSDSIFNTSSIFGFLAISLAAINIFGGFLVTQRMLAMYKKKKKDK